MRPLAKLTGAAWCFGAASSSWEPRGCARTTATWLPQRREGLDKGTFPGGRFPKGGHLQGLALAGFLPRGHELLAAQ